MSIMCFGGKTKMITKGEKTKEIILEESRKLFAKKGFNLVTMKDVCEATGLSRGGLYSHFSGTKEIFEALMEKLNQVDTMDFEREIQIGKPATEILTCALSLLEEEMNNAKDSLSLAIYEYSAANPGAMDMYNKIGEEKWVTLIEYGILKGEFKPVNIDEIVTIILYVYQGVRMWSRIVSIPPENVRSVINHIKKQLLREE